MVWVPSHRRQLRPATTYPQVVGAVLAKARNVRGLNQDDMARHLGIAQATWSRFENGQSSISVEHFRMAAHVLEMHPANLMQSAEQTAFNLQSRGITVLDTRDDSKTTAVVLIAGLALAAFVGIATVSS